MDRYYPVTYTCTTTARIARVAITTNALRAQAGYTHIPTTPSSGMPRSFCSLSVVAFCSWTKRSQYNTSDQIHCSTHWTRSLQHIYFKLGIYRENLHVKIDGYLSLVLLGRRLGNAGRHGTKQSTSGTCEETRGSLNTQTRTSKQTSCRQRCHS